MKTNIELDTIHNAMSRLVDNINDQIDNYIIEGLKRKGYEFENKYELGQFIINHCKCEDSVIEKTRIYFVNNEPFFSHYYGTNVEIMPVTKNRVTKLTASYGSFSYI